ncbi:MAG: hypothetical protein EOO17_02235 [Chloroflexi bacterium]|nr:MAG: hypothetical protein EOO17_02235 [Chloroflexota bacterium]
MFRKLVSNLSFSPALITQVSFYAKRLRKEEVTRRMTIVFAVLALVMQSLAVFSPPESANASSEQDLVRGGITNTTELLELYDKNTDDIKDIYSAVGVTRSEIVDATAATINSKDSLYSVTRYAQYSPQEGEVSFSYQRSAGGSGLRHTSPLALSDASDTTKKNGTTYSAYVGSSQKAGWFAIIKSNASIVTKGVPTQIAAVAQTTPLTQTISSFNTSQNIQAGQSTAKPFDKIRFTVARQNDSDKPVTSQIVVNLRDTLEYATLVDAGGGLLDSETKELSWPPSTVASGQNEQRTYVVQIASTIAATATGSSNASSYDCVLSTSFGTTDRITVECPALKGLESVLGQLPPTTIGINIVFITAFLAITTFFYLKTRQLKTEIRMIRHSINNGVL